MKKGISILLALIIALSCCTVIGFSAIETDDEAGTRVYLLGDADLDGEVTIIDVTLIQRYLVNMTEMNGLQIELTDVADTGLDITSATLIQRYIVGMQTKYPIGENAADENEGVVYEETLPLYSSKRGNITSIDYQVVFSTAYPDVAFISDSAAIAYFADLFGYPIKDIVDSINGDKHGFVLPNGAAVIFDYENKVMVFSDYSTFVTVNGSVPFNPYGSGLPTDFSLFKTQPSTKYFGSDAYVVSFDYKTIPMLRHGEDIAIPLQTFSDYFTSQKNTFLQYNGNGIFKLTSTTADSDPVYWKFYNDDTEKLETVSPALAQVNYYELCAAFEGRYGLKKAHDINDFDSYFRRRGLRDEFLSGDVARIETAVKMLGVLLFEDFHSGSNTVSPFLSEDVDVGNDLSSPIFLNRREQNNTIGQKRYDVLGTGLRRYERHGDTVFITFDAFDVSSISKYYTDGFEPSSTSPDTIELFAYTLKRLQNEDSDVKNVVVDISCNGGGAALACGFAMEALIGKAIICVQNPNTSALTQNVTKFDLNLDGVIDDNDISMKAMGKNIAVIISDASFSCGNLLPCSLNALDDDVLLLGQQSGGGACVVSYLSTALGSIMQFSGEQMLVTMKNGYIRDIDGGVAPEIPLSLNRMYDRDYIIERVNDHFGV